jgi:hypothetical protein
MGFEPTIPASERAKTVNVLDRAATVICTILLLYTKAIMINIVTLQYAKVW